MHTHGDLAVADPAERPGVLPGDTRRRRPLLGQPGVVDPPHPRHHHLHVVIATRRRTPTTSYAPTTRHCASGGIGRQAALRQLGNRLVGILHGCPKTGTSYNEITAWNHLQPTA